MTGPAASIRRTAPAARAAPAQPLYSLAKAPSGLPVQGRLSLLFPFRSKMGDFAIFGRDGECRGEQGGPPETGRFRGRFRGTPSRFADTAFFTENR